MALARFFGFSHAVVSDMTMALQYMYIDGIPKGEESKHEALDTPQVLAFKQKIQARKNAKS